MIKLTILGQLASMKNRRRPTRQNPFVTVVNDECKIFARDFVHQVPRAAMQAIGSADRLVRSKITVYYTSLRPDLDCTFVYDLLQKTGVVRNDRYIRDKREIALVDKANPRVEIELEEM